jgi:heme A synthase
MYHVIGAVVTTISVCALVMCVSGEQHDKPMLVRLAGLLGGLFVAQLMLGVGAYVFSMSRTKPTNAWEWVVPSTHVVVGAAVLATSVAVAVAVIRFMGPASVRDESAAVGAAA